MGIILLFHLTHISYCLLTTFTCRLAAVEVGSSRKAFTIGLRKRVWWTALEMCIHLRVFISQMRTNKSEQAPFGRRKAMINSHRWSADSQPIIRCRRQQHMIMRCCAVIVLFGVFLSPFSRLASRKHFLDSFISPAESFVRPRKTINWEKNASQRWAWEIWRSPLQTALWR